MARCSLIYSTVVDGTLHQECTWTSVQDPFVRDKINVLES